MGNHRVAALRAERQAVLEFFGALTPEEWEEPSGCPGWSVKGVLSHMSAAFHGCFHRPVQDLSTAARRGAPQCRCRAEQKNRPMARPGFQL